VTSSVRRRKTRLADLAQPSFLRAASGASSDFLVAFRDQLALVLWRNTRKQKARAVTRASYPGRPATPSGSMDAQLRSYGSSANVERKRALAAGHLRKEVPHGFVQLVRWPDNFPAFTPIAQRSGRMAEQTVSDPPRPALPRMSVGKAGSGALL